MKHLIAFIFFVSSLILLIIAFADDTPDNIRDDVFVAKKTGVYGPPVVKYTLQQLVDAIQTVEVGGAGFDVGIGVIGDNGNAIGPFQIHLAYYIDAHGTELGYEECLTSYNDSVMTFVKYMKRYAPKLSDSISIYDCQIIARIHNGGPCGHSKQSTLKYWEKVREILDETNQKR